MLVPDLTGGEVRSAAVSNAGAVATAYLFHVVEWKEEDDDVDEVATTGGPFDVGGDLMIDGLVGGGDEGGAIEEAMTTEPAGKVSRASRVELVGAFTSKSVVTLGCCCLPPTETVLDVLSRPPESKLSMGRPSISFLERLWGAFTETRPPLMARSLPLSSVTIVAIRLERVTSSTILIRLVLAFW